MVCGRLENPDKQISFFSFIVFFSFRHIRRWGLPGFQFFLLVIVLFSHFLSF